VKNLISRAEKRMSLVILSENREGAHHTGPWQYFSWWATSGMEVGSSYCFTRTDCFSPSDVARAL